VLCRVLVMFRSLLMVFVNFVIGHIFSPGSKPSQALMKDLRAAIGGTTMEEPANRGTLPGRDLFGATRQ